LEHGSLQVDGQRRARAQNGVGSVRGVILGKTLNGPNYSKLLRV